MSNRRRFHDVTAAAAACRVGAAGRLSPARGSVRRKGFGRPSSTTGTGGGRPSRGRSGLSRFSGNPSKTEGVANPTGRRDFREPADRSSTVDASRNGRGRNHTYTAVCGKRDARRSRPSVARRPRRSRDGVFKGLGVGNSVERSSEEKKT